MSKAAPSRFSLGELASHVGGVVEPAHAAMPIVGLNTVESAQTGDICFVENEKYLKPLTDSKASAVLILESIADKSPCPSIRVANPKWAFAKVMELFYPNRVEAGIHPSAVIGKQVVIDPSVSVGPNCVIGDHCHIGANTVIHPNVTLYSNVTLGCGVTIHSGAILGSDGFGFAQHQGKWLKMPHVGGLKIGNYVEIGANTTIDRGMISDTVIEEDVIIDNLVHIAHNVHIGAHTAIAACVGIAGSAKIGRYCQIGGGSIINGHISIAAYTYLIAGSQVGNSIKKPGLYSSGIPAKEYTGWVKNVARFHQLNEMANRLKALENQLKQDDKENV